MPKKNADFQAGTISFEFEDAGTIDSNLDEFPPEIIRNLALHGLSQKCGDSYAGAAKAVEGTEATASEYAKAQVERVLGQLQAGEWRATGGGDGTARQTDLAVALAEATGKEVAETIEMLANLPGTDDEVKDTKAKIRNHPEVAKILQRIKAERAAKKAAEAEAAAEASDAPSLADLIG